MAQFDRETLKNLEKLSRIKCTSQEEEDFVETLSKTLDFVELLSEIDTSGISNCTHILKDAPTAKLRKDLPENRLSREAFLENAPEQIGGMIKVPHIIKSE